MSKDSFVLSGSHFSRMAFVVKEDLAFSPVDRGILGAVGIMIHPDGIVKLVEKLFKFWVGFIGYECLTVQICTYNILRFVRS